MFQVQVEVEEEDITGSSENSFQHPQDKSNEYKPVAKIRDTSRNRLQRLGALYSNHDISSPIHRTEGKFHDGTDNDLSMDTSSNKMKKKYGKLAALTNLANTINQWEDDSPSCHSGQNLYEKQPVPETQTTRPIIELNAKENVKHSTNESKTKQLKWDPKVLNSLEAQGFQRRDSTPIKIAYDYTTDESSSNSQDSEKEKENKNPDDIDNHDKYDKSSTSTGKSGKIFNPTNVENNKVTSFKPGLVSGRAAIFENKNVHTQPPARPQKDPTELSLKERMQLFEKNKGQAPVPKAPFGMAVPINRFRQEGLGLKMESDLKGNLV